MHASFNRRKSDEWTAVPTREEKEAWLSTLFQAISEILRKKSSLRLAFHSAHKSVQDPDLGLKQPILIRTDSVTKCMNCGLQFSVVRRKHHCRACGSVPAQSSEAIMEGFLNLKTHKKSWQKRWFSLHRDFVLYSYKNVDDQQALTATPMPGFTITRIQNLKCENGLSEKDRDKAFKVYHSKKQYLFLCPTKDEADRWVAVLQKASCAELPPTQ
ncbi:FYVE, RhoGEF and PH domain-containing protein 2 [Armadillidium vulgare]|nr:FYVE, RhoGEF and PH domain-containing protein 2 [Armadillidium vulgare]